FTTFLPGLAFAAVAYLLLWVVPFPLRTELVAGDIVLSIMLALLLIAAARVVFFPEAPVLRLLPLSDQVAGQLYRWFRRVILWGLIGRALFANIGDLRVPPGVFEGLERIWGLFLLAFVIDLLFRYRVPVTNRVQGSGEEPKLIRRFLARIWLPVAIVYAVSAYLIWALEVQHAFQLLFQGGLMTLAILFIVQPVAHGCMWLLAQCQEAELTGFAALLQERFERYASTIRFISTVAVYALAIIAIAWAWNLSPIAYLGEIFSGATVELITELLLIALIAWILWEAFDFALTYWLTAEADEIGTVEHRSARVRTLVPLVRTIMIVVLLMVLLASVLSSFGLDIGPLLATAGVLGIAIGFGAQKLVQDVITGLFILFQDTISVGDIVDVGGHSGVVERITVRTLELRDLSGALHTIPFSAVSTVKNMSRNFAYALMDIGIAYKENAEAVMEVIKQVGAEFECDAAHGEHLLSSLDMWGVNDLAESSVIIRCRFKVLPNTQWAVRRAFLSRVKQRFDELGIEIPFPQRTVHWRDGTGPTVPANASAGMSEDRSVGEDQQNLDSARVEVHAPAAKRTT
ncbi:MAG TPA: mechanosensitive ion channel domain-containing protein, partial [Alphaproteobacteria bacterium]|nr:mechanosensitive ion channel domain-containing protein [Alphaproteobacteria bacterium]